MPLTDEQKRKFRNWLDSKVTEPECMSCGSNNWIGEPEMISGSVRDAHGNIQFGTPDLAMVVIVCTNCAFTKLYAAKPIGLVEEEESSP